MMQEQQASVRLVSVSKYYETAAQRVTALENLSWSVSPGEAVALMGPSGCGKSTILNLLGGMDRPTKGGVFAGGGISLGSALLFCALIFWRI
jgi:ABC-type lipoprotein export system ATPase subunit